MKNLMLSTFVLGATQATVLKEEQVLSYDETFAGLTAEMAEDTNQDIELVQNVMHGHLFDDFQETQVELGAEDKCEWTVDPKARNSKPYEWTAWVKSPVCRFMVYPKYPYPRGMKWAQIKVWRKTPKGKAIVAKYRADTK